MYTIESNADGVAYIIGDDPKVPAKSERSNFRASVLETTQYLEGEREYSYTHTHMPRTKRGVVHACKTRVRLFSRVDILRALRLALNVGHETKRF